MSDILQDLSHRQQVVEAIEANMFPFWMGYGYSRGSEAVENERLMYYSTGVAHPLLNGIFRAQFTSLQIEPTIRETIAYFRERQRPALWWVGPTTRPSDMGEHLAKEGIRKIGVLPGMAVPLNILPESVPTPENFRIERVSDITVQRQWIETLLVCNDIPANLHPAAIDMDMSRGLDQADGPQRYVGFLNDEPVATSALLADAGVAGLYAVGTLPSARGKGIGAAMSLLPLLDARKAGYQVGVLQSSDMGHRVYKRLGFVDYCEFELYLI